MTAQRHARLASTRLYLVASFAQAEADRALAAIAAAARVEWSDVDAAQTAAAGSTAARTTAPWTRDTSRPAHRHVAGAVQLRCKGASTDALRELLARAATMLPRETLLIVNDDLDAVLDRRGMPLADGVHLGRQDAAATPGGLPGARARLGPDLLLGTSTRTLAEVEAALAAGADHVGFGAMAPTQTKTDTTRADPDELRRCLAAHPSFPIFPIGGLDPDTLRAVTVLGCPRAAVGGYILQARDPAAATLACAKVLVTPAPGSGR